MHLQSRAYYLTRERSVWYGNQTGGVVSRLLADVPIPRMFRAEQLFPGSALPPQTSPPPWRGAVPEPFRSKIRPGMSIAITAGSRGIANVDLITRSIADFVKARGRPFIVPAMGSHGSATAEGQLEVLASYGITPEAMGCEIRSSMEVVELGTSDTGLPVYLDKNAYEADGIIVSCRLKPHNAFRGPYESGPCKMLAVGLGKQKGAERVHSDGMGKIGANIPPSPRSFWPGPPSSLPCPASRTPMTRPAASRPSTGTTFSPGAGAAPVCL